MTRRTSLMLAAALVVASAAEVPASPQTTKATPAPCDAPCLEKIMSDFINAMTTGEAGSVPLAGNAEVRENGKLVRLSETAWRSARGVRSSLTFTDPLTGNVVSRAGVELAGGKPGYISTRLKIGPDGRITDVELSADTSSRVVAGYVWNLSSQLSAVVPEDKRMSRVDLEALARRYFHSLSTHVAVTADFDERCDRYHSGQKITNVSRNTVEGGPPRTCAASLEGSQPWGPATEQRFPVIDADRGIVFGITLLHYPTLPNRPKMYVSEVFKVIAGRIVHIDNLGLMLEGVTTLGFNH